MTIECRRPVALLEKPACRIKLAKVISELCGEAEPIFVLALNNPEKGLQDLNPSLIIVDLGTVNNDFELVGRIAELKPSSPIVTLDDQHSLLSATRSQDAGASGYVAKTDSLIESVGTIHRVLNGDKSFPPPNRTGAVRSRRPAYSNSEFKLSAKQYETLTHISTGLTNKEIAEKMNITPGTVKVHTHSVLKAIGARNRTEAALIAGRILFHLP